MTAPAAKKAAPKKAAAPKKTEQLPAAPVGPVYTARRVLTVGDKKYKPGDVVPEANGWTRVETWVRAGYIDVQGA